MKQLFTLLLFTITTLVSQAQDAKTTEVTRLIVSDVHVNKLDATEQFVNDKAYMSFYRVEGSDDLYLANIRPAKNTQSYGKVFGLTDVKKDATATEYKSEVLDFKWSYNNDYDGKQGTATIKLGFVYKPNGTAFVLTMLTEGLDVIVYKGYVSGTLNLKEE